jgi:hypothetical protein
VCFLSIDFSLTALTLFLWGCFLMGNFFSQDDFFGAKECIKYQEVDEAL